MHSMVICIYLFCGKCGSVNSVNKRRVPCVHICIHNYFMQVLNLYVNFAYTINKIQIVCQ